MASAERKPISVNTLIRRTVALEKAAGDIGDGFLQYLYGIAILHLEDRAGRIHYKRRGLPAPEDRCEIEKLAKQLMASAKAKAL